MWLVIMEAVGLVSKTAKGFFGDSGVSIDNWTFKFFYKVMYYFAKVEEHINENTFKSKQKMLYNMYPYMIIPSFIY